MSTLGITGMMRSTASPSSRAEQPSQH
jgi:hypothetical protein